MRYPLSSWRGGSFGGIGLSPTLGRKIAQLPEIEAATPIRVGTAEVNHNVDLVTAVEHQKGQLAHSLSLCGLDDVATAAVNALRIRIARGDIRFDNAIEAEAMIANLGRAEMRKLNILLSSYSAN